MAGSANRNRVSQPRTRNLALETIAH